MCKNKVQDYLNKISLSSKHLLSLINDILDMSKIERSNIPLNRMQIFLPDLLKQLSAIMSPQAKSAELIFQMETEGIAHPHFWGDPLRINQIFINILGNAIKFTPEGGMVTFAAQEIPSAAGEGYVRYRFTIADTGVG